MQQSNDALLFWKQTTVCSNISLVETENDPAAEISGMNAGGKPAAKPSIGKTGVHLCYHMPDEYHALSNEQKDKLHK